MAFQVIGPEGTVGLYAHECLNCTNDWIGSGLGGRPAKLEGFPRGWARGTVGLYAHECLKCANDWV